MGLTINHMAFFYIEYNDVSRNTHTNTHNTQHAKNLRNPGRIHDPNLKQQVDVKRNLNDVRTRTLALTMASKSTLTSTTQLGFAVGGEGAPLEGFMSWKCWF